jgi:hypothetical protein
MSEVAVIIPAYIVTEEHLDWLHQAVDSIPDGTEIVIVDDDSPLKVPEIKGIRPLRHMQRLGAGAARNTAIRAAKAQWILPLDADDQLTPNGLQMLYNARCERAFTYGDLEFFGTKNGVLKIGAFTFDALRRMAGTNPVTALFHRNVWHEVNGYDEKLEGLEDVDFAIKLASRGICGNYIGGVTMRYRRHPDSRHSGLEAGNKERLIAVRQRIQDKHWRELQSMSKCDKCPGGGGEGTGVPVSISAYNQPDGITLRYIGQMAASFTEDPSPARKRYQIEGKGTLVLVHPDDAVWMLEKRWGGNMPKYERV